MRTIIHYATALQTPLCYRGRTERVDFNRARVTCGNCIDKLKEQVRGKPDWAALQATIDAKEPAIERAVIEWCFEHGWKGRAMAAQYPPRVCLDFYLPIGPRPRRRVTVGHNISPNMNEPNIIQVLIPTAEELDEVASLVGELGDTHGLRARRVFGSGYPPLEYELRPDYVRNGK